MKLTLPTNTISNTHYDNNGAYLAMAGMMKRNQRLSIQFKADNQDYPYAWIESRSVAGFKLILNQEILNFLMAYLNGNKVDDLDLNPNEYEVLSKEDAQSFAEDRLKEIIESGKQIQVRPLFREQNGFISAFVNYKRGNIFFRVPRTEEMVEFLKDQDLLI